MTTFGAATVSVRPAFARTSRRKVSVSAQAPPNPDLERARLEATDAFSELVSIGSKQSRNRTQKVRCDDGGAFDDSRYFKKFSTRANWHLSCWRCTCRIMRPVDVASSRKHK